MNFIPGTLYRIKNYRYHVYERFGYYNKYSNPPHSSISSGEILFFTKINVIECDRIKMTFLYRSKEISAYFCTDGNMQEYVLKYLEQI